MDRKCKIKLLILKIDYFLKIIIMKNREIYMDKENLKKKLFELYEKLERDKDLYKEFIANEDKFLQDRGYDPVKVKELFQGITKERNNILKGVLEDQDKIIP